MAEKIIHIKLTETEACNLADFLKDRRKVGAMWKNLNRRKWVKLV